MSIFTKKGGGVSKFGGAFASKKGKPSVFSKVLNVGLTALDFIPVIGEASAGVQVGVGLATAAATTAASVAAKKAVKAGIKSAEKVAVKSAVKSAEKVGFKAALKGVVKDGFKSAKQTVVSLPSSITQTAIQQRTDKLAADQSDDNQRTALGDSVESSEPVKSSGNGMFVALALAFSGFLIWFLKGK